MDKPNKTKLSTNMAHIEQITENSHDEFKPKPKLSTVIGNKNMEEMNWEGLV